MANTSPMELPETIDFPTPLGSTVNPNSDQEETIPDSTSEVQGNADSITNMRQYVDLYEQDFARPAVKLVTETLRLNDSLAAYITTPLILGITLASTFFVFFTSVVCLWAFGKLAAGALFFVVKIFVTLIFKLLMITGVSIPLAIVSTTLFISIKIVINVILYAADWVRKTQGHPRGDWSSIATQAFSDVKSQVPNVQNTIKIHSSTAARKIFQIPFRKTGSQMMKLITSIPWMQMIHVVQSSLQILLSLIQIAFASLRFAFATVRLAIQGLAMTLSAAFFACHSLIVVLSNRASTPQPKAKAE